MKRKICIPFSKGNKVGGPYTFLRNLESFLSSRKYGYLEKITFKCSGVFFIVSISLEKLKKLKKAKLPIVQRLDGIYYYSKHGLDYKKKNSKIKEIYRKYSTKKIFQSLYCRNQCFEIFGEIPQSTYSIIYNGVDKKIFYPAASREMSSVVKLITTGNFRNIDMLEPIVKALDELNSDMNFQLNIVGPIANESLIEYLNRDYIKHYSSKNIYEVADLLRESDIFIYSHLNPPCPNSVIEAISCGLPVVGYASGSMSELCSFSTDLLAFVSDDIIQKYDDFNYKLLADKIKLCINKFSHFKKIALDNSYLYDFKKCGEEYIKIFEQELNNVNLYQRIVFLYLCAEEKINHYTKEIIKKIISRLFCLWVYFLSKLTVDLIFELFRKILYNKTKVLSPAESLKFLFKIENELYSLLGRESIRYGNGLHTKHKHINYHNFFINNISENSRVLDIGCGNGSLALDIVSSFDNVTVYGIDLSENNIKNALHKHSSPKITYISGDALEVLPEKQFDIIVLSNVLEHIEYRTSFLKRILAKYSPDKILIRVPCFERDWRVPLKAELKIDYRLDSTHYIEYKQKFFFDEMANSNLKIVDYQVCWGEIWAVCVCENYDLI